MSDDKTMAVVGLILNILILPGLGTIIASKEKRNHGIWQLVIAIISIPLMLLLIGFITWFAVWIWALVDSIKILQATDSQKK